MTGRSVTSKNSKKSMNRSKERSVSQKSRTKFQDDIKHLMKQNRQQQMPPIPKALKNYKSPSLKSFNHRNTSTGHTPTQFYLEQEDEFIDQRDDTSLRKPSRLTEKANEIELMETYQRELYL